MALKTHDVHGSETPSVKRGHERMIFKNHKLAQVFSSELAWGFFLVSQAAAWSGWRLQRLLRTPRSTAFCPVEDLQHAAGIVCSEDGNGIALCSADMEM